ncbi:hypothetical protein CBR_g24164 [Chara braunii]|uniref:Myb/SANT-like DNA-binding domain-containing protein n=1 Tax=Chara braunii TaxID=69332 RepID=A0A388L5Z2_CHABU|nr:hypothetical protein CBR_g24164 [Chara braunii]|eukprot:GBG77717.1 hypothetical protein CBR_g24164 [Chara braunii]
MADVFRKLLLLLLAVILLLVVVFVQVCILGRLPSRGRRKGRARKSVAMDRRRPNLSTLSAPYPDDRPPICTGVDRRAAGPSPYEGLPPHLQPLPDSDEGEAEVDVSRTVPLGSGSTQEWTGSQLYDRRPAKYGQSFTSLLHEGAEEEECLPPIDLTFGLQSGSPSSATRTVVVNPHPDDDAGQVTLGGRGTRGGAAAEVTSGKTTAWPRTQATSRARIWKEVRKELRRQQEDSITQGVQRLRVGERSEQADVVGGVGDVWTTTDEFQCDVEEDDTADVFPVRAPNMGGRGGRGRASTTAVRRRTRSSAGSTDAEGEGDGEGGRNFWSVEHMVSLIRAKRDQDAQLQASGHSFTRMRSREWKWLDVRKRLLKVGIDRPADKCGKKWDNLMQHFKKVHLFMGTSGREDFFQLTSQQRADKGFNFTMDRAMYDEIKGAKERSHTVSPTNVADIGGAGGVQLASAQSAPRESVGDGDAAADGIDEDDTSARGGSHTSGSPAGLGKRKNVRKQTFDALAESMDKHGVLMASTMESASKRQCSIPIRQCEAIEAEVEIQKQHCAASTEVSKLMCQALLEIAKAIRER